MTALADVLDSLLGWLKESLPDELGDGVGEVDRHIGSDPWPLVDLEERLPFVDVQLVGGSGDRLRAFPTIEVDVFGADRTSAYALAEAIRARLSAPGNKGGVVVDNTFTRLVPSKGPWENPRVFRVRASYELSVRMR